MSNSPAHLQDLPHVIIGAGPVGMAAAAQLRERGLTPLVLEAGETVGAAIRQWGHTSLFSPWRFNIDDAARRLLQTTSWVAPDPEALPTGHQLADHYLTPLAMALGDVIHTDTRVTAVSREGIDKTRSASHEDTPFLVRVTHSDGTIEDLYARSVIDASGTWSQSNPLGKSGLPAPGETEALSQGFITTPLPAIHSTERHLFAGRHALVDGKGSVTPFFQNGVYGECANSNIGRLTGLTTGGMRIQPSEDPELFVVDTVDSDWTTSIQEADVKGSYIMTLKAGDYEVKGVFTKEQVESGTAIIEFQEPPDQPVTRINYDPVEESFDAVDLVLQ